MIPIEPKVSAAKNPLLSKVFRELAGDRSHGKLCPGITAAKVNDFIRTHVGDVPAGFKVGAHGIRVGTDTELKYLGAPDAILDQMGWWRRLATRMSEYYGATFVRDFFDLTERLGYTVFTHLTPGPYTAPTREPPLPR